MTDRADRSAESIDPSHAPEDRQVWDLSPKMITKSLVFNAKAAETHGLMGFAVVVLNKYMDNFRDLGPHQHETARLLLGSVMAAERFNDILVDNGRQMDASQCQLLLSHYMHFMRLYIRAGGRIRPKFHLMFHCIQRISFFGNPRYYWAYKDCRLYLPSEPHPPSEDRPAQDSRVLTGKSSEGVLARRRETVTIQGRIHERGAVQDCGVVPQGDVPADDT